MKKIQPHHLSDGTVERRVVETDPDLAGMSWDEAADVLQRPKADIVIQGEIPPQAVEQLTARYDPAAQAEMMQAIEATMFSRTAGGTPFPLPELKTLDHSVVFAPSGAGMSEMMMRFASPGPGRAVTDNEADAVARDAIDQQLSKT